MTEPRNAQSRLSWGFFAVAAPLLALLHYWDTQTLLDQTVAPTDALLVKALHTPRGWEYRYGTGKFQKGRLILPKNESIRVILSSTTGIHPFRVVPHVPLNYAVAGRYTSLWFSTNAIGRVRSCAASPPKTQASGNVHGRSDWPASADALCLMEPVDFRHWMVTPTTDATKETKGRTHDSH